MSFFYKWANFRVKTLKVSSTINFSGLTASQAVFTDASKNLVSNTITGSGNVVMSTSPTLVTPALGTPSALVGTNITGTAAGLTAGNVTTNANLTGPITSVGNATAVAAQTGTGSTFVMQASPSFTTSIIGDATFAAFNTITTNLSIGGAATTLSIGASTGTFAVGNVTFTLTNATTLVAGADLTIRRNTSDGADSGSLFIASGGSAAMARGALIALWGNESVGVGLLELKAGNVTGGHVELNVNGAVGARLSQTTGAFTVNTITVLSGTTAAVYNTVATTVNAFGAATTLTLGASTVACGLGVASSSSAFLNLPAGTTAKSTLRVPHGSAPTSPVDGDIWTTTAGLFVRINGGTVGPLA